MAFIDFKESLNILKNIELSKMQTVEVEIIESLGYVLADDIVANENSPSEDRKSVV